MTPGAKVGVAVVAGGAILAVGLLLAKAANAATTPSCANWRAATDADVAQDGTQPVYMQLLNSQPVGYTTTGIYNGRTWKFVVCSAGQCSPPSNFQKDVRGYVCTG